MRVPSVRTLENGAKHTHMYVYVHKDPFGGVTIWSEEATDGKKLSISSKITLETTAVGHLLYTCKCNM